MERQIKKELSENLSKLIVHILIALTNIPHKREQKILMYRVGLGDGAVHSLEETGKEFGVTRERIRQIEAKALEWILQAITE